MAAGPSRKLESLVGLLIPPACREEVLGDLCERYRGPGQYVADGARVALFVNLSGIRRTTSAQLLLMEAMMLYLSFLTAAWFLDRRFLNDEWGLLRLAAAPAIALFVLRLNDAWAMPRKQSAFRSTLGVAAGVGVACLCQIGALPAGVDLLGAGISLLLVSAVRVLFLPGTDLRQPVGGPKIRIGPAFATSTIFPASRRMRDVGVIIFLLVVMGLAIRWGAKPLIPTAVIFLAVAVRQINKNR
jgi:hypothetical protein